MEKVTLVVFLTAVQTAQKNGWPTAVNPIVQGACAPYWREQKYLSLPGGRRDLRDLLIAGCSDPAKYAKIAHGGDSPDHGYMLGAAPQIERSDLPGLSDTEWSSLFAS